MKYNTISSGSLVAETRKSTLTIYADMDISMNKLVYTEGQMASIRGELEIVQKALKLQTKRCRQLVAEYTRKLQEKELQYNTEKTLRDDQLAKVLRALLMFEARLRQEQKFITHQLNEKDYIINKQTNDIKKLLSNQYCKNCKQYYTSSPVQESLDSSSEYVATDYQDYQSSNFESLDSSSETYASLSGKPESLFRKHHSSSSLTRKSRKIQHRKSTGTYFEVLKLRNDSPCSNEDNTSNDYDHLDSLPPESLIDKQDLDLGEEPTSLEGPAISKITEAIPPVFEGDGENNENWYASGSDPEDEEQRDIYRNNPVLECMNQILLQNIDPSNSPPKTPSVDRKVSPQQKKVKFSDEEDKDVVVPSLTKENLGQGYYETPVQKTMNIYETPQSIYSNDYEQILSKCSETFSSKSAEDNVKSNSHYYVDMEPNKTPEVIVEATNPVLIRKTKILRTPPALPPKPANLVSKYKISNGTSSKKEDFKELEPDYCSISELNLPVKSYKKVVIAEINSPTSNDVKNKLEKAASFNKELNLEDKDTEQDNGLVVKKCIEKLNIQIAKQTPIIPKTKPPDPPKTDIPKLPQVSEILIPEDSEEENNEQRISQDNYVKNNSQIFKQKILIGSSVSTLITGFNNQLISEIKRQPKFASFEDQKTDKPAVLDESPPADSSNFDLSQTFEEFKLDECDMEEFGVEEKEVAPVVQTPSVDVLKKQFEMKKFQTPPTYEHFLECTGLSSKSILTPSRMLSNHKTVLKPKDVKMRSRVRSTASLGERQTSIKYWSEPFI